MTWQYKCTHLNKRSDELDKQLETLGKAGWEMVQIVYRIDDEGHEIYTAFFKRPAASASAGEGE